MFCHVIVLIRWKSQFAMMELLGLKHNQFQNQLYKELFEATTNVNDRDLSKPVTNDVWVGI